MLIKNSMNRTNTLLIASMLLVFWTCQPEEEIFLSPELAPYFETFAFEAAERNIQFDYVAERIEGILTNIEETDVSGKCEQNSVDPNRVYIDQQFWRNASELEREFIVFHELGHCFLDREHLETTNSDGTCKSIMHSGLSGCRNLYGISTRKEYLDELFLSN